MKHVNIWFIVFFVVKVAVCHAVDEVKLIPSNAAANDRSGCAIALDGDTALVGAYYHGGNGVHSGAVYVFARDQATWGQQAKLTTSDAAAGNLFGWSIALDGDTTMIEASNGDVNGSDSGSAYIYLNLFSEDDMAIALARAPVAEGNEPPMFTLSGDVTVNEDFSGAETVTVTADAVPADEKTQTVSYSLAPASVVFANVAIDRNTGEVTITAAADGNGSQVFTVTANDDQNVNNTAAQTFTLTVDAVNDSPTFTLSGDVTVDEDFSGTQAVAVTADAVPADERKQMVSYRLLSPSVDFANVTIDEKTGEVTITAVGDGNGSQVFTITANDGQPENHLATQTFSLTIHPQNDAPTVINPTADITVDEDTPDTVIDLFDVFTDVDTVFDDGILTLNVDNSSPDLLTATLEEGMLTLAYLANQHGTAILTLTATDSGEVPLVVSHAFIVTVDPLNDLPILAAIGNQQTEEGADFSLPLSATDVDIATDGQHLVFSAESSDGDLIFVSTESASANTATLFVDVNAEHNGTANIMVAVNDGQGEIDSETFAFTVNPVNDPPILTAIGDQTTYEDVDFTVVISASDLHIKTNEQQLNFAAQSSSADLVKVAITSTGVNTATLAFDVEADQNGVAEITVTVVDEAGEIASEIFQLTVTPVNDVPSVTDIHLETLEDTPLLISLNGSDIDGDALTFGVVSEPVHGSLGGSSTELLYTPNADFSGTDSFTYQADDGQAINNLSEPGTVTLTVEGVNDAPFAISQPGAVSKGIPLTLTLSGLDADGDTLTAIISRLPVNGALFKTANGTTRAEPISTAPTQVTDASGRVIYVSNPNGGGHLDTFGFRVTDGTVDSDEAVITLNVTPISQPPGELLASRREASAPLDQRAGTYHVEDLVTSDLIQVTIETLGDLKPAGNNAVSIQIANRTNNLLELETILKIDGQAAPSAVAGTGEPTVVLDVGETWRIRWPKYELNQAGNHEMNLEIKDLFDDKLVYHARIPFTVPLLYEANYGGLLKQSAAGAIWWTDGARKVSRERPIPQRQDQIIRLKAAKNEYEPFQFVLRPAYPLSQVKVEANEFTNVRTNDIIPQANTSVLVVDYVFVEVPTDAIGTRGYWPDPLQPHDAPLTSQPELNQPFWITVYVPPDVPAGTYRGSITVRGIMHTTITDGVEANNVPESAAEPTEIQVVPVEGAASDEGQPAPDKMDSEEDGECIPATEPPQGTEGPAIASSTGETAWSETVEVELQVWDFALPEETHVQSGFGFSPENVRQYHHLTDNKALEAVLDKYYRNFKEHRISPYNPMSLHPIHVDFGGHWWLNGAQDESTKIHGTYSLKVVDDKTDQNIASYNKHLIPIDSWASYELGWRVRTEESNQMYQVTLVCYDQNEEILTGENIDLTDLADFGWQRRWIRIGWFPPDAHFIRLNLFPVMPTASGDSKGAAWFDDLSLIRLPDGRNIIPDPDFERTVEDWEIKLDYTDFEQAAKRYLDEFGFNLFRLPLAGMGSNTVAGEIEGYQEGTAAHNILFSRYVNQLQDYLEGNSWLDKAYVYWFDEPAAKDYKYVKAGMDRIHEAAPKLTRLLTAPVKANLVGSVDIWCPATSNYNPADAEARRASGEKVWWYVRTMPKSPYAGLFIDHYAVEMRIWLWQTWKYKVDGILVWHTNYWTRPLASSDREPQNPYRDTMSYSAVDGCSVSDSGYWGNGDGRFLYPPKSAFDGQKSIDGPVNSIRWEMLREGIEDYEYFWLLNAQVNRLKNLDPQNPLIREAEGFLNVPETIVVNMTDFSADPAPIYAHRSELARMIETLSKQ